MTHELGLVNLEKFSSRDMLRGESLSLISCQFLSEIGLIELTKSNSMKIKIDQFLACNGCKTLITAVTVWSKHPNLPRL